MKVFAILLISALLFCGCYSFTLPRMPRGGKPNPINKNFTYVEVNKVDKEAINLPYPGEFYTGYITVNQTSGSKMFYQLYTAGGNKRASTVNDTAPLILSLAGGPGVPGGNSYYETGPFRVILDDVNFGPVLNEVTWNDDYHLLYIDNPVGVGYSVVADDMPAFASANGVYLMNFLERFFQLYPSLKQQDFYLQGESYGGHFVLGLAIQLLSNPQLGITFKGVAMQDGWFDPYWQSTGWADGLWAVGVLDNQTADKIANLSAQFRANITQGNWQDAYLLVPIIEGSIPKGAVDLQDYRNNSDWDPTTAMWLNLITIKNYLAADPATTWQPLSLRPWYHLDFPQSYASNVSYILNNYNISFLFYQGQNDFLVPSAGTKHAINNLKWTGIANYLAADNKVWRDTDGYVIGQYKHYGKLTYATVNKASHNAAHDQPWSVKNLINRWVSNNW